MLLSAGWAAGEREGGREGGLRWSSRKESEDN